MLDKFRVVLVEPSHPGNIGAAARAMKNMGLSRLALVTPKVFPSPEAVSRASGAEDVLEQAQVVPTLEEALAGCRLVLGTSARLRHLPWPLVDPSRGAELAVSEAAEGAEVALVFGREHAGLTNEELQRCQYHVQIPTNPEFSSLNLGAAVQVLVYELRLAWLAFTGQGDALVEAGKSTDPYDQPCTVEEMEAFYQHLERSLVGIGFLHSDRPRHLMARLRRLYGRAQISHMEMNILRGILSETDKVVQGDPHKKRYREIMPDHFSGKNT